MALKPATNNQVPEKSILDAFDRQTYLGNAFIYASPSSQITSTSETPYLLLSNPSVAASAFPSGFQALFVNMRGLTCLTASQTAIFRYYIAPTVSNVGTPATPVSLRPANSTTSIAALSTGPTTSANGSCVGSLATTALMRAQESGLIILDPGQSLLVTAQASSTSTYVAFELGWYQL